MKNLGNTEYLAIILNGKRTLAERFAQIDSRKVIEEMKKHNEKIEKLNPKIKKILKMENMLQIALFGSSRTEIPLSYEASGVDDCIESVPSCADVPPVEPNKGFQIIVKTPSHSSQNGVNSKAEGETAA